MNLFLNNRSLDIAIAVLVVIFLACIIFFSYFLPLILKRKHKKEGHDCKSCRCKK